MLPHETESVQGRQVGVESAHSFGDTLFNIPLIKALHDYTGQKVAVATRQPYVDGFKNVPWVSEVFIIGGMGQGVPLLKSKGYQHVYQITQNAKFPGYQIRDPNHSLVDTPLWVGREIGLPDFDQRPIFLPTEQEIEKTNDVVRDIPTIAIECDARSAQSWANDKDIARIIDKYKATHRILWLSIKPAPSLGCVDDVARRFSRRETIMCLRAAQTFYSVGSGFFCSALALPKKWQPGNIVCLWEDRLYKYMGRLNELKWHEDITWITSRKQFSDQIESL